MITPAISVIADSDVGDELRLGEELLCILTEVWVIATGVFRDVVEFLCVCPLRESGDVAVESSAGVTDYLTKSVGTDQYTSLIRRVEHAVDSDGSFERATMSTQRRRRHRHGRAVRASRRDLRLVLRLRAEELVGKHSSELHPPRSAPGRTSLDVGSVGTWTGQSKGLRADETTFTESKMVTALEDGRMLIAVDEIDDSGWPLGVSRRLLPAGVINRESDCVTPRPAAARRRCRRPA